jgi:hypothetical protein
VEFGDNAVSVWLVTITSVALWCNASADLGEGWAYVWQGGGGNSVHSSWCHCDPTTALKILSMSRLAAFVFTSVITLFSIILTKKQLFTDL